jgi:hypothetical protein
MSSSAMIALQTVREIPQISGIIAVFPFREAGFELLTAYAILLPGASQNWGFGRSLAGRWASGVGGGWFDWLRV